MEKIEQQIASLTRVAKIKIAQCKFISSYPVKQYKNFNPSSGIDNFYKQVCNSFFSESLLIVASLLDDNQRDRKQISFWKWKNFEKTKKQDLEKLTRQFRQSFLAIIER